MAALGIPLAVKLPAGCLLKSDLQIFPVFNPILFGIKKPPDQEPQRVHDFEGSGEGSKVHLKAIRSLIIVVELKTHELTSFWKTTESREYILSIWGFMTQVALGEGHRPEETVNLGTNKNPVGGTL